jgi:hypothetical protein
MGPSGNQVRGLLVACVACLLSLICFARPALADKAHHVKDRFRNVYPCKGPDFFDFLKWRWNRFWKKIPGPGEYNFPLAHNDPAYLRSSHGKTTLTCEKKKNENKMKMGSGLSK